MRLETCSSTTHTLASPPQGSPGRSRSPLLGVVLLLVPALCASASRETADPGPTFYQDVLPILQENCQYCHRSNGANLGGLVAPMPLTTFEEVRPWAKSMARQVESRTMPPWHAASEFNGMFANERTLSDEQIDTLLRWVRNGVPAGKAETTPPQPTFAPAGTWQIGEPDLVVEMPEAYFVGDEVEDQYVTFITPLSDEMLPEDRYIQAVEFRPGSSAVHHILSDPLGGTAPGAEPLVYPRGFGQLLRKGSEVSFQMHYHKEPGPGTGVWDRSRVALKFYPPRYEPEHTVRMATLGNLDFEIPPGVPDYRAKAVETFKRDVLVLSYLPHMHLRGRSARYVAFYPDEREEVLLDVPAYDFNWQTTYKYRQPRPFPAGTRIEVTMAWDNSADNPKNPDPTKSVRFGPATTDEMMFGFVSYAFVDESQAPEVGLAKLQSYVGSYEVAAAQPPAVFNIGINNGALTIQFPGRVGDATFPLTVESDTRFSLGVAGLEIAFLHNDAGQVKALRFRRGEDRGVAEKVR